MLELADAFLRFRDQLPAKVDTLKVVKLFNAKFHTAVRAYDARRWIRMFRGGAQAQDFIEFYLGYPNSPSQVTAKVLKEFNEKYETNVSRESAQLWVLGHSLLSGQSREQRRAHFIEFYNRQDKRLSVSVIATIYNETAPLGRVATETARVWINQAQDSTQQPPQSPRQPAEATNQPRTSAGLLGSEMAHESDIEEEAASILAQSGKPAIDEEMFDALPVDGYLHYPVSSPLDPLLANTVIDSNELLADADFVEKRSFSPVGMCPAPSRPSSQQVADQSEKQASAHEEEPLDAPPIEDFLEYVASNPSDPLLANMVIDSNMLLPGIDFVEKRPFSRTGMRPAPSRPSSQQVADQSEKQVSTHEEEPLDAPPIEDFLEYVASNPSDPLLAGLRFR